MSTQQKSLRDLFIEQQIERTVKPFLGITPPELLATIREGLEDTLRTLPAAVALIDQLVAQAAPLLTEENPVEGAADGETDEASGKESS